MNKKRQHIPQLSRKVILEAIDKSMADQRALLKRAKKLAAK
jgi:hypothetical protein